MFSCTVQVAVAWQDDNLLLFCFFINVIPEYDFSVGDGGRGARGGGRSEGFDRLLIVNSSVVAREGGTKHWSVTYRWLHYFVCLCVVFVFEGVEGTSGCTAVVRAYTSSTYCSARRRTRADQPKRCRRLRNADKI